MTDEDLIASYDNDASVYRSTIHEQTAERVRYWVDSPQHHYVFTNSELTEKERTRRRALAWAAIISSTSCHDDQADVGHVPVKVSICGKPYVAAYLFAIHDQPVSEIAKELDLTAHTISQYVSDVVSGRR